MTLDLLLLAFLSAFWPTLIVVDVLAFQTDSPERILLAFLAGGLLTTVTIGTLIVVAFDNSQFGSSSQTSSTDVVLDLVIAGLAFLCALILARMPRRPEKPQSTKRHVGSDLMARAIDHGAPLAFVGGILFNIVPGLYPLIAIKDMMQLHYSTIGVVAALLVFYLIMFLFLEVPIVAYLVAGHLTGKEVMRFNAWLSANHRRIAVWVLVAGGCYLTATWRESAAAVAAYLSRQRYCACWYARAEDHHHRNLDDPRRLRGNDRR